MVSLVHKYSNILVTRTFSKAFGMAGLRLGYCVSHPDNANLLRNLANPKQVTCMAQRIGLVAMTSALDE